MAISETLVSGLAKRDLNTLEASGDRVRKAANSALDDLIYRRCANLKRKMRANDFRAFARQLDRTTRNEPARVDLRVRPMRPAQPGFLELHFVTATTCDRTRIAVDDGFEERVIAPLVLRVDANPHEFNAIRWGQPVFVCAHLVERWIERETGDAVSAAELARLSVNLVPVSLAAMRVGSLGFAATQNRIADTFGPGTAIGGPVMTGALSPGRRWLRNRHGRYQDEARPAFPGHILAWRTYYNDAMLTHRQRATRATHAPTLARLVDQLAADRRVALAHPLVDTIDHETLWRARCAAGRAGANLPDQAYEAFFPRDPARPRPGVVEPDPDIVMDAVETEQDAALAGTRRALWGEAITRSLRVVG